MSKDLTKKDDAAIGFMKDVLDFGYTGFENLEEGMISLPFLKIAQGKEEIVGIKPGDFYNSITGKIYGQTLQAAFLGFDHAWLEWGDGLGDYKGRLDKTEIDTLEKNMVIGRQMRDGKPMFDYLRTDKSSKKIQEAYTFFLILPEYAEDGILMFSMKATSMKHVKKLLTKARAQNLKLASGETVPAPMYSVVWQLRSMVYKNDAGQQWRALGDKTNLGADVLGNMLEDKYVPLQKQVIDAARFVKELQFSKLNLAGSRDVTPESEE